ncbi:DMT family transporter [Haloglomus litoreum]|uniref:DMT family transporter n=1 Tax=Haloglomus litoreum TaxID=3034026 RepID=UPI0023E7B049|nr:EamA family transporter [Haloglomus sp. DT116]
MSVGDSWSEFPTVGLAFVVLATLWGGSFVAIEAGVDEVPPLLFAALRYDLAGVFVLAWGALRGVWLPRTRDDLLAVGLVGALLIAGYHALLYVGQTTVPGAVAAAVVALVPVLTALFAAVLLDDERLAPAGYGGVALGFLGVVVVSAPGSVGAAPPVGVALILGATVLWALGTVLVRRLSPRLTPGALQGWGMLLGAGALHAGSLLGGERQALPTSPTAVGALAFLVLGSGVVAFLLYFYLLGTVGATEASLVDYAEPVTAAALAWGLFGYVPSAGAVLGFLLVAAGFLLVKHEALLAVVSRARTTGA